MRRLDNPKKSEWSTLSRRPNLARAELSGLVSSIFEQVKRGGDDVLFKLTEKYDGVRLSDVEVPIGSETTEAALLQDEIRSAIDRAYRNIWTFHESQLTADSGRVETQPGVVCWRESRPIELVGLYVPAGSAPLVSTMLMLGVPAQLAGCRGIVACTPPGANGVINAAIRYAAAKCGIETIYRIGGAQAIAAMTFGTESVPKVDKLFGPGNQYVTAAKQLAQEFGTAIDMPAGPSEVLVVADDSARANFVAADLLSQAEHGPDSQVVLLTTSRRLQASVSKELKLQLCTLPRRKVAERALKNSLSVRFSSLENCIAFANAYAPEHLILQTRNAETFVAKITDAGSVFIGPYTPESAGDYASGTNHTLPTGGWARTSSGLSVEAFQKKVSFQAITKAGLGGLSSTVLALAEAEGLAAHAQAVSIRLQ